MPPSSSTLLKLSLVDGKGDGVETAGCGVSAGTGGSIGTGIDEDVGIAEETGGVTLKTGFGADFLGSGFRLPFMVSRFS